MYPGDDGTVQPWHEEDAGSEGDRERSQDLWGLTIAERSGQDMGRWA